MKTMHTKNNRQFARDTNKLQKLVLDNDKPCIQMVKQVKDLNNKIFLWNLKSDKEYIDELKLNEL